jgi:hypothetical protein
MASSCAGYVMQQRAEAQLGKRIGASSGKVSGHSGRWAALRATRTARRALYGAWLGQRGLVEVRARELRAATKGASACVDQSRGFDRRCRGARRRTYLSSCALALLCPPRRTAVHSPSVPALQRRIPLRRRREIRASVGETVGKCRSGYRPTGRSPPVAGCSSVASKRSLGAPASCAGSCGSECMYAERSTRPSLPRAHKMFSPSTATSVSLLKRSEL